MSVTNASTSSSRYLILSCVLCVGGARTVLAGGTEQVESVDKLAAARRDHTATLLSDGRVLIAGGTGSEGALDSSEIFDPATRTFSSGGSMIGARAGHTATLLSDGRVLMTGGLAGVETLATAEIFDPATAGFRATASPMSGARACHAATMLASGWVLITGGDVSPGTDGSAEVFDPVTEAFTRLPHSLTSPRCGHSAALLPDGSVALFGGGTDSAEVFDPITSSFSLLPDRMSFARSGQESITLSNGNILLVGGDVSGTAETFDAASRTFAPSGTTGAGGSTATLLANGKVLIIGESAAGLFSPGAGELEPPAGDSSPSLGRKGHTALWIPARGRVLVAGGASASGEPLGDVLLYNPARVETDADDYPPGSTAIITGSGFLPGEEVELLVLHADETHNEGEGHDHWTVTADLLGEIVTDWHVCEDDCAGSLLELTATGHASGLSARTRFTDSVLSKVDIAPAYSASSTTRIFSLLVQNVGLSGDQRIRRIVTTIPSGYASVSVVSTPTFSHGAWAAPTVAGSSGSGWTVNFQTTTSTDSGLPPNAGAWARLEIQATTPSGNNTGTWTVKAWENQNASGNNQETKFTAVIRNTPSTARRYTATFRDAGGAAIASPLPVAEGAPTTYRIRLTWTSTSGSTQARYMAIALPTCFESVGLGGFTGSYAGSATFNASQWTRTLVDNVIRIESRDSNHRLDASNEFVQMEFTATASCSTGLHPLSTAVWQLETGPKEGEDQVFAISGSHPTVDVAPACEAPEVTCPAPVTVQCEGDVPAPDPASVVATGDCTPITVTHVGDQASGDCPKTITRTYRATDSEGNSATCTQTITVDDTTPPVITCPGNAAIDCTASSAPGATGMATATDNCPGDVVVSHTDSVTAGNCVGTYTIRRTWTATDRCENQSSCVQTITVTDTLAPAIACPADQTIDCAASSDPAATGMATATDDCSGVASLNHSDWVVPGSCAGSYTIQRTWTARDGCGNQSSCLQTITVTDTLAPAIDCPADVTIDCAGSSDPTATGTATADDDCSGVASLDHADQVVPGSCAGSYTIERTWTARDGCGNQSSCVQTISVTDTLAPVVTCPADISASNDPGMCGAVVSFEATASDDCSGVTLSHDPPSGSFFEVGTTTVTVTARDGCNNTSQCQFTVTVNDTEAPAISCPPDQTVVPAAGCSSPVTYSVATATDNCPGVTVVCSPPPGSVLGPGAHTVECTATDAAGNTSTCQFTVTVLEPLQVVFLPPLSDDNIANNFTADGADAFGTPEIVNYFTAGSRIPHKVKLLDCVGNDVTSALGASVKVTLSVTERTGTYLVASTSNSVPTSYTGVGDAGGRLVLLDGHFQYNLNTTGFRADTDNDGKSSSNDKYYFQSCVKVEYTGSPGVVVGRENAILESR